MKTLILNDCHLGVKRQAGTTKQSRKDLENWMMSQFEQILDDVPHNRLIILGDLFDKRNVDEHIMKRTIDALRNYPRGRMVSRPYKVIVVAGNHDLGGIEDHTLSSAEFVTNMADMYWLDKPEKFEHEDLYVIPHMHSQEEFDRAVQDCPDNCVMLVHCNIDSPFAHGDHSLNLSLHQLKDLEKRGVDVIAGHEHNKRDYHNVTVLGNQFPSSIADCLGGDKYCHVLDGEELTEIKTWDKKSGYYGGPEIEDHPAMFINITGECEVSEFTGIVKDVAELRKKSMAAIVKNSVKIEEFVAEKSDEDVTQFNVVNMLLEELPEQVREEVKSCL